MKERGLIYITLLFLISLISILDRTLSSFPLDFSLIIYISFFILTIIIGSIIIETILPKSKLLANFFLILFIIISYVFYFLLSNGFKLEAVGAFFYFFPMSLIFLFLYIIIFIFLSYLIFFLILNKGSAILKIILIIFSVILLGLVIFIIINYSQNCGMGGCAFTENLAERAYKQDNPSLCNLSPTQAASIKYPKFTPITNNRPELLTVNDCYEKLAQFSDNPILCEKVTRFLRPRCFWNFANKNKEFDCSILSIQNSRNACYYAYALRQGKREYCDKITTYQLEENDDGYLLNEFSKERCLDRAKSEPSDIPL